MFPNRCRARTNEAAAVNRFPFFLVQPAVSSSGLLSPRRKPLTLSTVSTDRRVLPATGTKRVPLIHGSCRANHRDELRTATSRMVPRRLVVPPSRQPGMIVRPLALRTSGSNSRDGCASPGFPLAFSPLVPPIYDAPFRSGDFLFLFASAPPLPPFPRRST